MTEREKVAVYKVIAEFVKVARHVRNFPHPELTIEQLRSEAVMAETNAENIFGKEDYDFICHIAFNQKS